MGNGVEVRSVEELRDNFSISMVMDYLQNGKLVTWLRDRYANDIADLIEELDFQDEKLAEKVSEIFDVPYDEASEKELEKAAERAERILKLKEYSDDGQYEKVIDNIAFDQDELYDLLDEDANTIYLCGERFSIPLSKPGVAYIGINHPVVVIDSKVEVDWEEKRITVENVVFDKRYQSVLDSAYDKKRYSMGAYSNKSHINFMIPEDERKQAENFFQIAKREIEEINYDIDADISRGLQEIATKNGIIDLAKFETLIEDINESIDKHAFRWYDYDVSNVALGLIFDYGTCNEYAKIIIDKSVLRINPQHGMSIDKWKEWCLAPGAKTKTAAAKEFVKYCGESKNISYKFIFWSLLILTVDKNNAQKYLSLVCDFAKMLKITNEEFEDIIHAIKCIYNEVHEEYIFKSESIPSVLGGIFDLYGGQEKEIDEKRRL